MKKLDYAKLPTEKQNPHSLHIDRLSIPAILRIINKEDQTVPNAVHQVQRQIARGVEWIVDSLKNGGTLYFAGAGTSGRLGVIEAAECPPTFGTPPNLIQAVIAGGRSAVFRSKEGAEDKENEAYRLFLKKLKRNDTLVGIAASGVTPFVKGALRAAKEKRAHTILIACNAASPLKNLADSLIAPRVGPEAIAGSTRLKAGTATKLILNMLTVTSMIRLGKVYENWMVDLKPKSRKLKARAVRLVERLGGAPGKSALAYLKKSRNNVKLAILMARKGYSYSEAQKRIKKASGFLREALRA